MLNRLKNVLPMLFARLSEPSTYAGLSGLATLAGVSAPAFSAYAAAAAVIFGVLAILMPEKTSG
jgi:hypothetical protein